MIEGDLPEQVVVGFAAYGFEVGQLWLLVYCFKWLNLYLWQHLMLGSLQGPRGGDDEVSWRHIPGVAILVLIKLLHERLEGELLIILCPI